MSLNSSRRTFLRNSVSIVAAVPAAPLLASPLAKRTHRDGSRNAGLHGAVGASNPDAKAAGVDVLRKGGNAIDAAIAAFMVQTVREPGNTGLGGYGGSLITHNAATARTHAIDFDSRTPLAFRPELYKSPNDHIHGYLATGVPGNAAGFDLALREFGTYSWNEASKYAVEIAENGFVVDEAHAKSFALAAGDMDAISHRAYFPDGVPTAGQRFRQKDLARLYRRLGDEGPRTFYTGEVAATIARQVQANGGILSEQDLRLYGGRAAENRLPRFRGLDGCASGFRLDRVERAEDAGAVRSIEA